jgi:hypothetical protein
VNHPAWAGPVCVVAAAKAKEEAAEKKTQLEAEVKDLKDQLDAFIYSRDELLRYGSTVLSVVRVAAFLSLPHPPKVDLFDNTVLHTFGRFRSQTRVSRRTLSLISAAQTSCSRRLLPHARPLRACLVASPVRRSWWIAART